MPLSQKVGEIMDFTIANLEGWLPYSARHVLRVPITGRAS
ncbi:hypothetical protein D8I24_2799 (plasmid) [Cupriavidus necator H850]|nr:hypothetical protein D8I24_2799 [Cupriavidus necator H850]